MADLLRTKIELPPLRQPYIHRDRVLRRLSERPDARLALVSAPAGFGKSTLLLQWAHGKRAEGVLVAWYAVDEQDNDPTRFAAYLLGACRTAGLEPDLSGRDGRVPLQEAVTLILNAAARLDDAVLLLLDDYHLIAEPAVHEAVRRLCEYMPANMRLAVGARFDPPLPLARMRSRGEMAEIRMTDLRFNAAEVGQWCDAALGWRPSRSSVDDLERTTEGWAAALALIMMHRPHTDEAGLEKQLARYSHSQRHIFEYFAQEILEQQPEAVQHFLLSTSVLNQLTPALCTVLTEDPQAPLLLDRLAAESLFVIPLSDTEPIYRYHHLFAQFLRRHLALKAKERYAEQHHRAARWYAEHGDPVEAVDHALAVEDFVYASDLIQEKVYAPLMARGEFRTLVNWLPRFPTAVLAKHPRLWLYFVRALYLSGNVEMAETHVQLSQETLDRESADLASQRALRAIACNYRATLAAYRGDLETGLHWIEQAKALETWVDERDRVRIASADAFIRYLMGDVAAARRAYRRTLAMAEQLDNHWVILDVHYYLAQLELLACDLQAAQTRCERLLEAYPARMTPRIPLMLPLAEVHYHRDQLIEAERLLREALDQAQNAEQPSTCFYGHIGLSRLLAARGESAEAEASIAQARAWAAGYQSRMIDNLINAAEARLMLQTNRLEEAAAWAAAHEQTEGAVYHQDEEKILLAQIRLAQGRQEQALTLGREVAEMSQAAGRSLSLIQAELVQALAHQAAGKPDAALSPLEKALRLARPHRFVRLFLDMGRPMHLLLRRAVARGLVAEYAQFLLDSAEDTLYLDDLLTEREVEVLAQVATGASNQTIAETLVISVGTVKSHIHHIMSKLDAQNRTEAVSKARSLNILPD